MQQILQVPAEVPDFCFPRILLAQLSLSMVVLNSRDLYENVWLLKNMCLEKQPFKNHNAKNQLQLYWYNTNNAIASFKVAKCC